MPEVDGGSAEAAPGWTYLDLVRELGHATCQTCDARCNPSLHRQDAASHLNALIGNPHLVIMLNGLVRTFFLNGGTDQFSEQFAHWRESKRRQDEE